MDMIADIGDNHNNMNVRVEADDRNASWVKEGQLDWEFRKRNKENYKFDEKKKRFLRKGVEEFPLCEEITLEIFEERFMPKMQRFMSKSLSRKLSPTFIWTEIMSVIKGSLFQ